MKQAECRNMAVAVLVALGFWMNTGLRVDAQGARVRVDAERVVRVMDARLFGINTAIWDSLLDTAETVSALRELDVQALRFPGGSLSDDYHWASGTLGKNSTACGTSFANFVHVATNLHAQVFITVNSLLWWDLRNGQDQMSNNSPALYGWRQYGDHGIMSGNDTRYLTFSGSEAAG
jgi:hypothetical protein